MGIGSGTLCGAALLWAFVLGCDGSDHDAADAAATADAGDAAPDAGAGELPSGAILGAPTPPELPRLTCAEGWRSADGVCEPWPETGAASCADDEAHFPGTPGCVRLGPACAADGWPVAPMGSGTVRWVRAGAASGGDGSQSAPFSTINEALVAV